MASQTELYSLALAQGLTPARAKVAAAVGMAESGGVATAHNTNAATGDDSYGYWQINMLGDMGPERRKQLGLTSNDQLFDPVTNARAMKLISGNGTNFYPWTTYANGKHLKYMTTPVTDQSGEPGWLEKVGKLAFTPTGIDPLGIAGNVGSAVQTINKTARWISNSENWVRVGYVVGGSALVIVGVVMVVQSTTFGRAAMNLVPAGRVANIVRKVK